MPTGGIVSVFRFVVNKFRTIKSGNSLFELIIFLCAYYDVFAISYVLDHVRHTLPIYQPIVFGLLASALIKIIIMLMFDEEGPNK
jgi:hypothetical protein